MYLKYLLFLLLLRNSIAKNNSQNGNKIDRSDPMISDTAPSKNDQIEDNAPYQLTKRRLQKIRKHLMYPFYNKGGESSAGDFQRDIQIFSPQIHKNLNFHLPFFGFRYNYTRISVNGYLEFSDSPRTYNYPLVFPVKEWPKESDPAFIGIFFSKCKIGNLRQDDIDQRTPGVYFRIERDLYRRNDMLGVEIRERLKWDIREGIIGSETFNPKHAIIVTWKNVTFQGGISQASYHTNTFQMVLATDEVYTYAIFNYLDLDWTSHTEAGGDTSTGEGGVPAFVGFNAGNGTRSFEYQPFSQNSIIRDLTNTGYGNGFRGRHIFRIDEDILAGSCNKYIDGVNIPIELAPQSGNMLGGTIINVTGPCFKPTDKITCRFGDSDDIPGFIVNKNRAICIQPRLYSEGWVNLRIIINANALKWTGKYYIESPALATQEIYFRDQSYHEKSPNEIKMIWQYQNLTSNKNANVHISLWGYSETKTKPIFEYITDIASNVKNTGSYTIVPSQYKDRDNQNVNQFKFGFLRINLTEPIQGTNITPVLWSRPMPLGWYFQFQWEKQFGSNWSVNLCDEWIQRDKNLQAFTDELPQCPCTLKQALADKGKFMPDVDCDKDSNPTCFYNKAAIHCVKTGNPTYKGSEQQCCYDRNGYLMLSHDDQWGSSPSRSHSFGKPPYNEPGSVPTLSQWHNDIVPKYLCCLWQEKDSLGCRTLRYERRPTQDCVTYEGPGIAGVYGDPHIITFDDVEYTFNGKGEFSLVKSVATLDNLEVQGRFEQMKPNPYGEVKATQLTSIVAKGNNTVAVEVKKRPLDAQWRYRLDVIVDNRRLHFDRPSHKFQYFQGVTVYTPTYILNQSEVLIMFDNGAGVEIIDSRGYMSARVFLPRSLMNKTVGLFGNWSFNKEDEFTLPDGSIAPVVSNISDMERVYYDFGLKWMVNDGPEPKKGRSLFHREFGRTSSTYNNATFKPQFKMLPEEILPPNRSYTIVKAYEKCSENAHECSYDYVMTLDEDLAHLTQINKEIIYNLKQTARDKIVSCGILETPKYARKSNFLFVPGTKVIFECDEGYVLTGEQRAECGADGFWNVKPYGHTTCLRK